MDAPTAREVFDQLSAVNERRASLDDFYRWFTPHALTLPAGTSGPASEVIRDVELWFAEYTSGYRSEADLRAALAAAARDLRQHAAA